MVGAIWIRVGAMTTAADRCEWCDGCNRCNEHLRGRCESDSGQCERAAVRSIHCTHKRTAIGARVDLFSRDRVRAWVGGGLQIEHRTEIETDFVRSDFHNTGETTMHEFQHRTTYPVMMTGLTVYPAVHLLVFGGLKPH